MLGKNMPQWW